jgi:hypothetical protein
MATLTLPLPSGRGTRRVGILQYISAFLDGISEGRELATRYEQLAHNSDAELARLGLRREDIPSVVFAGRRRR